MVKSCVAVNCTNRWGAELNGVKLGFFRIPNANKFPEKRKAWVSAINRDGYEPRKDDVICGAHFLTDKPSDDSAHLDYVPQIFIHFPTPQRKLEDDIVRYERQKKRVKERCLASVRIEVERCIGLLKSKYQILKGPLPINLVKRSDDIDFATADKIISVCASLTNLDESIVNKDKAK